MNKKLLAFLSVVLLVFISIILLVTQQTGESIFGPTTTRSSTQLDTQAEEVSILQERISTTKKQQSDLRRQNKVLETSISDLETSQDSLTTQIADLESQLDSLPSGDEETSGAVLETTLQETEEELALVVATLTEASADFEANEQSLSDIETQISELTEELSQETEVLQSELVVFGIGIGRYILIILVYWLLYQIFRIVIINYIQNETLKDVLILVATVLAFAASIITLLIAFIGNITLLVTSFGVFSAALVVALQDMVSSIFAWILIKARGPFKKFDVIEIQFSGATVTGIVNKVGFLRTELKEKQGGQGYDREAFTGKTIFFPNNVILKDSFRNLTKDNRILWHTMDLVITFESDHEKAKHITKEIMQQQFAYMIDHKDMFLEDVMNVTSIYSPKVYLSIDDNGPKLSIWFACRSGVLRDVVDTISNKVLSQFKEQGVDLAYTTYRLIK